ncbi:MAG: hypothetical protein MJ214_04415 [Bacilli bacterium]|nr:hypothetical protein [Bacilli bacterium]
MKKDRILSNILFIFGIVLLLYSIYAFSYQTYLTTQIDWSSLRGDDLSDLRSYVIVNYVTIAVKIIIATYGIYCKKHVDEAINPLFTFTIFFVIFAVLETISTINTINGVSFKEIMAQYKYLVATASIDLIVAVFYLVVTLMLKFDDWRSQKDE